MFFFSFFLPHSYKQTVTYNHDLLICFVASSHLEPVFRKWTAPPIGQMRQEDRLIFLAENQTDLLAKKLAEGNAAILPEALHWETLREGKAFEKAYLLEGYLNLITFSFALRKGWARAAQVDDLFASYAEMGVFHDIQRRYEKKEDERRRKKIRGGDYDSIKVEMFLPVYAMLGVGAIVACFVTLIAVVVEKRKMKSTIINDNVESVVVV